MRISKNIHFLWQSVYVGHAKMYFYANGKYKSSPFIPPGFKTTLIIVQQLTYKIHIYCIWKWSIKKVRTKGLLVTRSFFIFTPRWRASEIPGKEGQGSRRQTEGSTLLLNDSYLLPRQHLWSFSLISKRNKDKTTALNIFFFYFT